MGSLPMEIPQLYWQNNFNILILILTQLPINGLINELINSSNYFINIQFEQEVILKSI